MKASTVAIGTVCAAAVGFLLGRFAGQRDGETVQPGPEAAADVTGPPPGIYRVTVGRSPQRGPDDALVTIVEFVDYQDEGVARAQPVVDEVLRKYGNKVRLVLKQNPASEHRGALGAAEAVLAAHAQKKAWDFHRRLVKSPGQLARADLEGHAKAVGIDVAQFRTALDAHEHSRIVQSDMRMADRFGVKGAPMFFVNGRPLVGVQTLEAFTRVIDRELPRAERVLGTGVPGDRLYAEILRGAKRALNDTGGNDTLRGHEAPTKVEDPNAVYKVPIAGAPVRGPATALVTIVEYTDFQ